MYEKFKNRIEESAKFFKELKQPIRIVSHLDSDGISAAAIISKLMKLEDKSFALSIVKQLEETFVQELSYEDYETYIFTDMGSGQVKFLNKYLDNKNIIILDHHTPQNKEQYDNITHINPHFFDIDGGREISGAGVTFLFARAVNKKIDDYAHLAIIGAIGDVQENNGFRGLNKEILQIAVKKRKIIIKQDLKLYGAFRRSIVKILEYSDDIKGISGNYDAAANFLKNLNIDTRKKLYELSEKEKNSLKESLSSRKTNIIGPVYVLPDEKPDSPFRDIREFSTLLNACGRLEKQDIGIAACLGNKDAKIIAMHTLTSYKQDLLNAINWFKENKNKNKDIINNNNYVIINAKENISPNIAGTLASIISKSSNYSYDFVITLAQNMIGRTKISFRLGRNKKQDLRPLAKSILENIEGAEYGGHYTAVGAIIPTKYEEKFMENADALLERISLEENIE